MYCCKYKCCNPCWGISEPPDLISYSRNLNFAHINLRIIYMTEGRWRGRHLPPYIHCPCKHHSFHQLRQVPDPTIHLVFAWCIYPVGVYSPAFYSANCGINCILTAMRARASSRLYLPYFCSPTNSHWYLDCGEHNPDMPHMWLLRLFRDWPEIILIQSPCWEHGGTDSFWVVNVTTCIVCDKFDHALYSWYHWKKIRFQECRNLLSSLSTFRKRPSITDSRWIPFNVLESYSYRRINLCALSGA